MDALIEWLADGKTLRAFCRQPGMPAKTTVYVWRDGDSEFAGRVARARDDGFEMLAEEALAIADTPMAGEITTDEVDPDGKKKRKVVREDMLGHRKLQIETRLKLLACWDPRRYGAKVELTEAPEITASRIRQFIAAARAQDTEEGDVDGDAT